jgi:hypothetical protein
LISTLAAGDYPFLLDYLRGKNETDNFQKRYKGYPPTTKPTTGALVESAKRFYTLTEAIRNSRTANIHCGVRSADLMLYTKNGWQARHTGKELYFRERFSIWAKPCGAKVET